MSEEKGTTENNNNASASIDTAALIAELADALMPKLNEAITGATGRVSKQIEKKYNDQLAALQARIEELGNTSTDSGKEEPQSTSAKTEQKPTTPSEKQRDPNLDKLEKMEKMIQSLNEKVEAEQKRSDEAEARATRTAAEATLLAQLSDRTVNPRHFLNNAIAEGRIEYKDGQFVTKTKDQFGDEVVVSVLEKGKSGSDYVDTLLASPDYTIYSKPRPGTGLGSSGSGKTAPSGQKSRLFADGAAPLDASKVAIEQGVDALVQELLSTAEG